MKQLIFTFSDDRKQLQTTSDAGIDPFDFLRAGVAALSGTLITLDNHTGIDVEQLGGDLCAAIGRALDENRERQRKETPCD